MQLWQRQDSALRMAPEMASASSAVPPQVEQAEQCAYGEVQIDCSDVPPPPSGGGSSGATHKSHSSVGVAVGVSVTLIALAAATLAALLYYRRRRRSASGAGAHEDFTQMHSQLMDSDEAGTELTAQHAA